MNGHDVEGGRGTGSGRVLSIVWPTMKYAAVAAMLIIASVFVELPRVS
jgi:hypothetical protein